MDANTNKAYKMAMKAAKTPLLIVLPFISIILLWVLGMTLLGNWSLFTKYWPMSLTMTLGSFIAGATSEGGGAFAFPVLTLIFKTPPSVARDFSWMIQAVGMSMAALTLIILKTPLYKKIILPISLGGFLGIIPGLEFIAPIMAPDYCKIFFTSLWLSFGIWIFIIEKKRASRPIKELFLKDPLSIKDFNILFTVGLLGGQISALTGTGLDIFTFAFLTLFYNLDVKKATLTSIVLMAINSLGGLLIKGMFYQSFSPLAVNYWWVSVPVVIFGAPLGAAFIKGRSKELILKILGFSILTQFILSYFIIPMTVELFSFSLFIFLMGLFFFSLIQKRFHFNFPNVEFK